MASPIYYTTLPHSLSLIKLRNLQTKSVPQVLSHMSRLLPFLNQNDKLYCLKKLSFPHLVDTPSNLEEHIHLLFSSLFPTKRPKSLKTFLSTYRVTPDHSIHTLFQHYPLLAPYGLFVFLDRPFDYALAHALITQGATHNARIDHIPLLDYAQRFERHELAAFIQQTIPTDPLPIKTSHAHGYFVKQLQKIQETIHKTQNLTQLCQIYLENQNDLALRILLSTPNALQKIVKEWNAELSHAFVMHANVEITTLFLQKIPKKCQDALVYNHQHPSSLFAHLNATTPVHIVSTLLQHASIRQLVKLSDHPHFPQLLSLIMESPQATRQCHKAFDSLSFVHLENNPLIRTLEHTSLSKLQQSNPHLVDQLLKCSSSCFRTKLFQYLPDDLAFFDTLSPNNLSLLFQSLPITDRIPLTRHTMQHILSNAMAPLPHSVSCIWNGSVLSLEQLLDTFTQLRPQLTQTISNDFSIPSVMSECLEKIPPCSIACAAYLTPEKITPWLHLLTPQQQHALILGIPLHHLPCVFSKTTPQYIQKLAIQEFTHEEIAPHLFSFFPKSPPSFCAHTPLSPSQKHQLTQFLTQANTQKPLLNILIQRLKTTPAYPALTWHLNVFEHEIKRCQEILNTIDTDPEPVDYITGETLEPDAITLPCNEQLNRSTIQHIVNTHPRKQFICPFTRIEYTLDSIIPNQK